MSCKTISLPGGGTAILSNGRRSGARCQTTGCPNASVGLCDYPVKIYGRTTSCNKRMCGKCRHRQRANVDYCPVHHRVEKAKAAP
jgi:hypothetical protein